MYYIYLNVLYILCNIIYNYVGIKKDSYIYRIEFFMHLYVIESYPQHQSHHHIVASAPYQ